jgi:hypothetical protein
MFQTMINGSIAVLTRPSVATFEEHEQNNLGWATIYVVIGAVIVGILQAITAAIQGAVGAPGVTQPSPIGNIIGSVLGALIGFFIFLGIVYLLGRAFGGTGEFGELAFDISLYWAPLAVLQALIGVIAIGPLAILALLALLVVFGYNIFLTYVGIQSGMDLPSQKALYVVLILAGIAILLFICVAVAFGALIAAMMGEMQ